MCIVVQIVAIKQDRNQVSERVVQHIEVAGHQVDSDHLAYIAESLTNVIELAERFSLYRLKDLLVAEGVSSGVADAVQVITSSRDFAASDNENDKHKGSLLMLLAVTSYYSENNFLLCDKAKVNAYIAKSPTTARNCRKACTQRKSLRWSDA